MDRCKARPGMTEVEALEVVRQRDPQASVSYIIIAGIARRGVGTPQMVSPYSHALPASIANPHLVMALPPTVSDILADPSAVRTGYARSRFSLLLGRAHPDTPSASFYRLYEYLIRGWNTGVFLL